MNPLTLHMLLVKRERFTKEAPVSVCESCSFTCERGGAMLTGSTNNQKSLVCLFSLILILTVGCATSRKTPAETQYPQAPDVRFIAVDGENGSLSDYRGEAVVLISFWGLRCQSCIEEMPFLERLHSEYGSRGLVILSVNTDGIDGTLLKKFLPQLPLKVSYSLIVDPDFLLVDTFEVVAAPLTIMVARDGTVRYRHEGYEPEVESEYVQVIEKLLAE